MQDLISREAAIAAIENAKRDFPDHDFVVDNATRAGLSRAAFEVSSLPSPWVSVKDRLPPKVGAYLVCESDGNIETADYHAAENTAGDFYRYFHGQIDLIADVTHWQPLPAPPSD